MMESTAKGAEAPRGSPPDPRALLGEIVLRLEQASLRDALRSAAEAVTEAGAAGCAIRVALPGLTVDVSAGSELTVEVAEAWSGAVPGSVVIAGDAPIPRSLLRAIAEQISLVIDARAHRVGAAMRSRSTRISPEGGDDALRELVRTAGGRSGSLLVWDDRTGAQLGQARFGSGAVCARFTDPTRPCPYSVDHGAWAALPEQRTNRPGACRTVRSPHALCVPIEVQSPIRGLAVLELPEEPDVARMLDLHHLVVALSARSTGDVRIFEPRVRIRCLGHFTVSVDGRPIPEDAWKRRQARTLVQMLAMRSRRFVARDALGEALWPGAEPSAQRNRLNGVVHALRAALESAGAGASAVLLSRGDGLSLDPSLSWLDVECFGAELAGARAARGTPTREIAHLEAAVGLYQGDLLADQSADWAEATRAELRDSWVQALARLATLTEGEERLAWLQRAVSAFPLREDLAQRLAEAQLQHGRRHEALQTVRRCERALAGDTGAVPTRETRGLHRRVLAALLRAD